MLNAALIAEPLSGMFEELRQLIPDFVEVVRVEMSEDIRTDQFRRFISVDPVS